MRRPTRRCLSKANNAMSTVIVSDIRQHTSRVRLSNIFCVEYPDGASGDAKEHRVSRI